MCARKVQSKQKIAVKKQSPKVIAKKTLVPMKAKTLKRGDLPETYVKGFHDLEAVRKMKYSPLGKTGMNVSLLSFGASSLGSVFRDTAEEEAVNVLVTAIKKGMNYIDTAAWYGHGKSERVLGLALKQVPRKAYYIATKACRYLPDISETFDFSYERTLRSIDESLERLGLTYVDVIQVHDMEFAPNVDIIIKQTLPAMQKAKELGKVRHIGLTGYPLKIHRDVIAHVPKEIKIGTIIIYCHYSMNDRTLLELMPLLKEKGIGLINAAAVSMGLLTNRGPPSWHPAGAKVKQICKKAAEYCDSQSVDISKLAMHFSLHTNKKIPTCLVSTASMINLEKNLASVSEKLSKKEKIVSEYCMKKFFDKDLSWSGHEVKQYRKDLKAAKAAKTK